MRSKPWADSTARQMLKKSRKLARAREEIARCNIEVRRVHSAIIQENAQLDAAVITSREERNPIAGAIADFSLRRQRVNARLLSVIGQIYALPGFSGNPIPGRRKGTPADATPESVPAVGVPPPVPTAQTQSSDTEAKEDDPDYEDASVDEAVVVGNAIRVLEFAMNYT